jgi:putative peptidoglycan lipid II flippase
MEHAAKTEDAGASERKSLAGRAGIVAAGTLVSRLLGLGRDIAIAGVFSRAATDAFMIAFLIPNVLRQLLAEGAVQSAVLPVLTETRERQSDAEARRFFRAMRGVSLAVLAAVAALGVLGAPFLVELFAGGFRDHPGQFERTVELTRAMFPYIFFMGSAALGAAALSTHRRFVAMAFAPGLLNVAFIACTLLLPAWLAARALDPILALGVGALLGGLLQVVAQWPSLRAIGYLEPPSLDLGHPGVRAVMSRMAPILFGAGVYVVDTLVSRRFLSDLGIGAQSYFGWALRLCDFPQGIFVMALQTATLPSLALLFAQGNVRELEKTFSYGMRLALFVGIPASALFVALAEPLVVLLFQRGEFDASAARETARALTAQGFGIWMVAAVRQLVAVYYAVGDTRTPVIVATLDFTVFVLLALALRGPFGHVGISIAVVGSSGVQMVLLWSLLGRRLQNLRFAEVAGSMARTVAAAAAAGAAAAAAAFAIGRFAGGEHGSLALMLPGAVGALVFAAVFLLAARLVRSEELAILLDAVKRRRRAT